MKRCLLIVNLVNDKESTNTTIWSTSTPTVHLLEWLKLLIKRLTITSVDNYAKQMKLAHTGGNYKNRHNHSAKQFPLCSKTKCIIFIIGYIPNRNAYTGAQKTYTLSSAIMLFWKCKFVPTQLIY